MREEGKRIRQAFAQREPAWKVITWRLRGWGGESGGGVLAVSWTVRDGAEAGLRCLRFQERRGGGDPWIICLHGQPPKQ